MTDRINAPDRVRVNLRPVIEEAGVQFYRGLKCCTPKHLYRIESGETSVNLNKLQNIADELDVSIFKFFE
jgi:transcriptional regulator with XRE-family HTH domain